MTSTLHATGFTPISGGLRSAHAVLRAGRWRWHRDAAESASSLLRVGRAGWNRNETGPGQFGRM